MRIFFHNSIVQKIGTVILLAVLIALPVTPTLHSKQVEAGLLDGLFGGGTGDIVRDPQNILTNTLQTSLMGDMNLKEMSLDGIFYSIAQKALQQMTQDILTFFNSGGENGDPMFITSYEDYLQGASDEAAKKTIYGDTLDTLCEPIEISVRVALAAHYQLTQPGGAAKQLACTIETPGVDVRAFVNGSFSAGGWGTWFETVLNPQNTALGGYQQAWQTLHNSSEVAQKNALLEQTNGVKPVKSCTGSGLNQECKIVTPSYLLASQVSASVNLPMQSLLNVDEFDEVVGNLFTNLASNIFTGKDASGNPTGVAGLDQNYFDAMNNDPSTSFALQAQQSGNSTPTNPIQNALNIEVSAASALLSIVTPIDNITRCSPDTTLTPELQTVLDTYRPKVQPVAGVVSDLSVMAASYASSTSVSEQQSLLSGLEKMRTDGLLLTQADVIQYQQYATYDVPQMIADFKTQTGYVEVSCPLPTATSTPSS